MIIWGVYSSCGEDTDYFATRKEANIAFREWIDNGEDAQLTKCTIVGPYNTALLVACLNRRQFCAEREVIKTRDGRRND